MTPRASCVTISIMRNVVVLLVVVASASVLTAPVAAQPAETPGGKLFEEGRELAKQNKFAEACDKFEKSYALDAGVGTELNLADCQEHLGHFAAAWRMFDEAAQRLAPEPVRQKFARDRADVLATKLGTVTVKLADPNVAGISVTIGGRGVKPQAEITERVDPGTIAVKITIAGKPPVEKSQSVAAGGTIIFDMGGEVSAPPHEEPAQSRGRCLYGRRGWCGRVPRRRAHRLHREAALHHRDKGLLGARRQDHLRHPALQRRAIGRYAR